MYQTFDFLTFIFLANVPKMRKNITKTKTRYKNSTIKLVKQNFQTFNFKALLKLINLQIQMSDVQLSKKVLLLIIWLTVK